MVPDRLSYSEMYSDTFKYPSKWTESFDSYTVFRPDLCREIIQHMDNYTTRIPKIKSQAHNLHTDFFSANELLKYIK